MGLGLGDYVQLQRRIPPRLRSGLRGTVVRIDGDEALVQLPHGERIAAPITHLARLVRAEAI